MLDRESTFADAELVRMLRADFVPVAIDQACQRRQQDAEGEFYRRFSGQSPRHDFSQTTQGFYVATAAGELLLYNNNRDPAKVRRLVAEALTKFRASDAATADVAAIEPGQRDRQHHQTLPEGGAVVRVHSKVLGGYAPAENEWQRLMQRAIGRDNLWLTKAERDALVRGELPETVLRRIARFHLVDNTRGEPPMWNDDEVKVLDVQRDGDAIVGTVSLATKDGARSFRAGLSGKVTVIKGELTGFELVADGIFVGEGQYTRHAPPGEFPFAVWLTLADGKDVADTVPPQGARGWLDGYLRLR
ncbi:MAG: hypothetical protein H6835_03635 [Planctomycetes bacterium]|nr:hypothetical protein [Planctomycetota bacterium]